MKFKEAIPIDAIKKYIASLKGVVANINKLAIVRTRKT